MAVLPSTAAAEGSASGKGKGKGKGKAKAKAKTKTKDDIEQEQRSARLRHDADVFFRTAPKQMEENQMAIRKEEERLRRLRAQPRREERIYSLEQMRAESDDELLLTADTNFTPLTRTRKQVQKGSGSALRQHDANTDPPPAASTKMDKVRASLRKPGQPAAGPGHKAKIDAAPSVTLVRGSGLAGVKATLKRRLPGSPEKPIFVDEDQEEEKEQTDIDFNINNDRDGVEDSEPPRDIIEGMAVDGDNADADQVPPPPSSPQAQSAGADFFAMMKHAEHYREELPAETCPPSSAEKKVTEALHQVRRDGHDLDQIDLSDTRMNITETERAQLDDLLDPSDRCPICDNPLPLDLASTSAEYMKQYHHVRNPRRLSTMSVMAKLQFCALHEAESQWIPLGRLRGYPETINWQDDVLRPLDDTWIAARLRHVAKMPMVSPFYLAHAQYVEQNGRDAWVQAVRHGKMGDPSPGYFGIIGRNLLESYFKLLDNDGALRTDQIPSDFMTRDDLLQRVLVPEAATLLIMANHLGWTKAGGHSFDEAYERANTIREQSILYGQNKFDDAGEMTDALAALKRHRGAPARQAQRKPTRRSLVERERTRPIPTVKPRGSAEASSSKRKTAMTKSDVVDLTVDTEGDLTTVGPVPAPILTPIRTASGSSSRSELDRTPQAVGTTQKKRKKHHKAERQRLDNGNDTASRPDSQGSSAKRYKSRKSPRPHAKSSSQRSESDARAPLPHPSSQSSYASVDLQLGPEELAVLADIESSVDTPTLPQKTTSTRPHAVTASQESNYSDLDLDPLGMAEIDRMIACKAR